MSLGGTYQDHTTPTALAQGRSTTAGFQETSNFVYPNTEYVQGWRLHSPCGQPVPVCTFRTLTITNK